MAEDGALGLLLRWHLNKKLTQRRTDAEFLRASLRFDVRFREKSFQKTSFQESCRTYLSKLKLSQPIKSLDQTISIG